MRKRSFALIHIIDLILRIKTHIAIAEDDGDEAGAKRLKLLLMEFEQ